MNKTYIVKLTQEERDLLHQLVAAGKAAARRLTHARILLKADSSEGQPNWSDADISEALEVSLSTVARVRERFVEEGLAAALNPRAQQNRRPRRLDGANEAHLIALACAPPPAGQQRWTLRLLADKMVELEHVESLSHETVRRTLKKTNSSRG